MSQSNDRTGARRSHRQSSSQSGHRRRAPGVLAWTGRIAVVVAAAAAGALFVGAGIPQPALFFPAFAATPRAAGPLLPYEIAVDGVPLPRVAPRWELRQYPIAVPPVAPPVQVASLRPSPLPQSAPLPPSQMPMDVEFAWIAAETPQVLRLGWAAAPVPAGITPSQAHALTLLRHGDLSGFQLVWSTDEPPRPEADRADAPNAGTPPAWLTVPPLQVKLLPSPARAADVARQPERTAAVAPAAAPAPQLRDVAVPYALPDLGPAPPLDSAAPVGAASETLEDLAVQERPPEDVGAAVAPPVEARGTAAPRRRPVVRRSVVRPVVRQKVIAPVLKPALTKSAAVKAAKAVAPKTVAKPAPPKPVVKPVAKPVAKVVRKPKTVPNVRKSKPSAALPSAPAGPKWSY